MAHFGLERFDKVIRFAQIRIAQTSREPTELTSGGVGRRLPEAGTFGLRPISGRKPPRGCALEFKKKGRS